MAVLLTATLLLSGLAAAIGVLVLLTRGVLTTLLAAMTLIVLPALLTTLVLTALLTTLVLATLMLVLFLIHHDVFPSDSPSAHCQPSSTSGVPRVPPMLNISAGSKFLLMNGSRSLGAPIHEQRSTTAFASARAARSALSLAAPALMSSPRVCLTDP
jgi:hypothetical protein